VSGQLRPAMNYLMLKAYLDASGTDPTKEIIVVGGWVASDDRWAVFVPQWRTFLVDCFGPNGGRWHHTDFHSRYRVRWTPFVRQPEPLLKV
jgi:hypothetical protein